MAVNINLKMGLKSTLPAASSSTKGTVYFAKDGTKNFGELYFDDADGNRVKIAPAISSLSHYYKSNVLTTKILLEDGNFVESAIPLASSSATGIVSTAAQTFAGNKTFTGEVSAKILNTTNSSYLQMKLGNETLNYIQAHANSMIGFCLNATASQANSSLLLSAGGALPGKTSTYTLGSSALKWKELYVDTINATSVTATTFTGALAGNAATASKLFSGVNINGTLFDGSTAITTTSWGQSRTISINSQAGTTGTSVNGGSNATLVIPSTMTGFTSITSTTFLGTNVGSSTDRIGTVRANSMILYQTNYSGGTTLARDAASTTAYTLHLPSASGRLVYHTKDTAIGGANAPVYVSATGAVTECGATNVAHGGTGRTTLTSGSVLVGNGQSQVSLRPITDITTAGTVTASTNLITANTLNHWTGSTNITTVGTIASGTWSGSTIAVTKGGTGTTTAPKAGGIIYGSSTSAYGCTNAGTSGYLLQSGGTGAPSWIQATNANTVSTIVKRDSSGNFSAGTITAALNGNATTATSLQTTCTINGIQFNGDNNVVSYATCSTAAATVAKTATLSSGFTLAVGAMVHIKFSYSNTATSPTLNISDTGAKPIYYAGSAISSSYLKANRIYTFVYDGTNYCVVNDINTVSYQTTHYTTTTNANYPILFGYNNTSTTTNNTAYDRFNTSLYINPSTGALTAPVFITGNYGTADPNTSGATTAGGVAIKGTGTSGALYFQIVT